MNKAWTAIVAYIQSFDPGLVRAVLLKIVRHGLTVASGILEAHGYLTNSGTEQLIALAPFVVGMALSVLDAYTVKTKITNAVIVGKAEQGGTAQKNVAVAALKEEVKS